MKIKIGIALLAAAIAAGAAIAAFAFFTNNGAGNGTAKVGTSSDIVLSGGPADLLYPAGADVDVTVTIDNSAGGGAQLVGTISGTVEDQVVGLDTCLGSWFEVDSIDYNTTVAPGATVTAPTKMRMVDSGTNQDVCKGLTMVIDWSSN
ncbi:MAG: hypothetical protein ABSG55_01215 [Dehalococcoidia bacterium]